MIVGFQHQPPRGDDQHFAQVVDLFVSPSSLKPVKLIQSIGITEEAITLPEGGAPGYAAFINRDDTNFINIKVGTAGAIFAKLLPGEFAVLRLGSGAQAPFAIADTAACRMAILIIPT